MSKYFDATYIWNSLPQLLPFLKITFLIAGSSILFGSLAGLLLTVMKLGKSRILKKIATGYTTIMRCTPSIVLLFLVYYGVPAIFANFNINLHDIDTAVFVVITFTLQFAAIMSEVIRSSYEAIDRGQYEAAVSVGLTPLQAYRRIIFPQSLVVALPNFGNSMITLLQEGSLAYTIGLIDVVGKANLIIAANLNAHALEIYIALAIIYWILSILIERIFAGLEKFFSKGKKTLETT
ncbi:amino acid ABC transporter permease [Rummeliibacillus sp. TYF005]|uniref:amino acid ABC transporter permease n=1 Tax=unclassified Rummeliibacillus TaxID=2622809 RepID=UPI000E65EBD4|nr:MULTISPECIES: amino acid ABC transporter permease [unclassified Rummeliibacillus]RIJ63261.1 amino acid ABC transporter permease [Rummeliibacillus sp. POC4]RPJ94312.1 amino acid ABC transporter permease [Rummeliibacillus sp. TYF005]